ncbi:MAG: hypothetical protein ACK5MY_17190 [Jhaorihella sp.]
MSSQPGRSGGAALDLDGYAVGGDSMKEPVPPVADLAPDDDIHRLISDAARLHREGRPGISPEPEPAMRAPATPPAAEPAEDSFHDDYRRAGIALAEDEGGLFDRKRTAQTIAPEMSPAVSETSGDADPAPAVAVTAGNMPDRAMPAVPVTPRPQPEPGAAPALEDRDDAEPVAPDSGAPARPVTELREYRADPFTRLERQAGAAPSHEGPSLFQRSRDRQGEAARRDAEQANPRAAPASAPSGRPRTRLSDNMVMPDAASFEMPAPAAGRAARHTPRVKTRLLGFGGGMDSNPFDSAAQGAPAARSLYPVGWMVVAAGPGRGNAFALYHGVSQIGRGEDQAVRLDFGDTSISRSNHAAVAYDKTQQKFYLGHGGKANLVRLNGKPVLSTEELETGSAISIGETTLHFVALCGAGFDWDESHDDDSDTAIFG